MYTKSVTVQDY